MLRSPYAAHLTLTTLNSLSFSFSYHKLTRAGSDSGLGATQFHDRFFPLGLID